jgi:hypothetical protein
MCHNNFAHFIFSMGERHSPGPRAEELRVLNRTFFGECSRWLSIRSRSGEIRKVPSELYYALWIGLTHERARHYLSGRVSTPSQQAADLLAEAARRALRGEGRA